MNSGVHAATYYTLLVSVLQYCTRRGISEWNMPWNCLRTILGCWVQICHAAFPFFCFSLSKYQKLECGPMPNVTVALPNTGGALCSTPQSLAVSHYYRCRAVTLPRRETRWNLQGCLKLPDGSQRLVGQSSPYCEDMWRTYRCLTSSFPIVDMCLSCEDIARQSCTTVSYTHLTLPTIYSV